MNDPFREQADAYHALSEEYAAYVLRTRALRYLATRATIRAERRRQTADAIMYGTRTRDDANRLAAEAWALVACLWARVR